jgi:iron(III) transport system substrate-binding protein
VSKRALVALAAAVLTTPMLTACGGDDGPFITVYNAQHEELIAEIAPLFEEETGIEVKLRSGKDLELANQLVQEGDASPADVFLTENSPAMSLVDNAGLFTEVDQETVDLIPAEYVPSNKHWIGFMGRSTVAMYNTDALSAEDMPDSILEFAEPEWEGRISYSPTGADFQAIVSAVLELEGEEVTRDWLEGLAENGTVYDGNDVVLESVNSGEIGTATRRRPGSPATTPSCTSSATRTRARS